MRPIACAVMAALAISPLTLLAADKETPVSTGPALEDFVLGEQKIRVRNKDEVSFKARDDEDIKTRELWYTKFENSAWEKWTKHGVTFDRVTPITWRPPEGHYRIHIRYIQISGLAGDVPGPNTPADSEFIIDRTAPTIALSSPTDGQKLRSGQVVKISTKVSDPYLHSAPVTISWSLDGKPEAFKVIASNLKNTGTFDWTVPQDMTPGGVIRVEAVDKALNKSSAEIKGLLVDAIAPRGTIKGPEITNLKEVPVQISAIDAGPAGMASATLWHSQDNGQTWQEGPAIKDKYEVIKWTPPTNGTFLLNLRCADQSGNITAIPEKRDDAQFTMVVDTQEPVVSLANNLGVMKDGADNTAVLQTVYKPGDKVAIPFKVTDANLTAKSMSFFFQVDEKAPWQELGKELDPSKPFSFEIPKVESTKCRVRVLVVDRASNASEAISAATFRIDTLVKKGVVNDDL